MTTTAFGSVESVEALTLGSALIVDAAVGTSLLYVDDSSDFTETGGVLDLNGVQLAYAASDPDADTVTLAVPLAAAAVTDDPVNVVEQGAVAVRWTANIATDDDDTIAAAIPTPLIPFFTEGTYDETFQVELVLDDFGYRVAGQPDRQPLVDGTYIDPDTLPPAVVATDGLPPASSPTPTVIGGIGALFVRWTPILNHDPVTYQVHVSSTTGFTPDATTLALETAGSSTTLRKLPTPVGNPPSADLLYDTPYYVKIVTKDEDGLGPVSGQASDQMLRITTPDIAADSINGVHIQGGTITGDLLSSTIILGSTISTGNIDTDETSATYGQIIGQRVDISTAGVRLFSPSGEQIISLPTNPDEDPTFQGTLITRSLTVQGGAVFQSKSNSISTDSGITLASGVSDPIAVPTGVAEYEAVPLQIKSVTGPSGPALGTFALNPSEVTCISESTDPGIFLVTQVRSNGSRIWRYSPTTGLVTADTAGNTIWDYGDSWRVVGMAVTGTNKHRVLFQYTNGIYYLYDQTQSPASFNVYTPLNPNQDPTLGSDGTNLLIAENDGNQYKVRTVTWNNSAQYANVTISSTLSYGAGSNFNQTLSYVGRGTFDFGTTKIVATGHSGNSHYVFAPTSGTFQDPTWAWPGGTTMKTGTMWYPGPTTTSAGAFYTLGNDGILRKGTGLKVTAGTDDKWWMALSWEDTVGTTHHTNLGPITQSVTMKNRQRLRVSVPVVPAGSAGVDDPNAYQLWMTRSASTPTVSAMHSQGITVPSPGATSTLFFSAVNMGGAAPPGTNNFPNANPGFFRSQANDGDYLVRMQGDGGWRLAPLGSHDASVAAALDAKFDTGWQEVAAGSGITKTELRYRRIGSQVTLRCLVTTNSAISVAANGGVSDVLLSAALPSEVRPTTTLYGSGVAGALAATAYIGAAGIPTINNADATGTARTISAGATINFNFSYMLG